MHHCDRQNIDLDSQHHCLSNHISIFFRFLMYPLTLLWWEADLGSLPTIHCSQHAACNMQQNNMSSSFITWCVCHFIIYDNLITRHLSHCWTHSHPFLTTELHPPIFFNGFAPTHFRRTRSHPFWPWNQSHPFLTNMIPPIFDHGPAPTKNGWE